MKLHFEPNLDYQIEAVEAVCNLFRGQEICRTEFTVLQERTKRTKFPEFEKALGIGNRLTLLDDEILENLRDVQLRGGLPQSTDLKTGDFTVEMETGTGKTYVYLRTIFELNKRYGFTKFVIIVPSVAIKEGVYKTLQITADHFRGLYAGIPFDYFLYDSGKLGQVRNFASSSHVQIMVVTVGAINKKDVNNLYKDSEKTGGEKPIDLIRETLPILIVDEPQSVDGGLEGSGKKALDAMNPLCTLRYSATHVDKHHMVHRLDAVDAYERKLVKQIEVASATVADAHNKPYVRLLETKRQGGRIIAKILIDVQSGNTVRRQEALVRDGDQLEMITGREMYRNLRIGEIRTAKKDQFMELRFPGGEQFLRPGQAWGDVDPLAVQREMIRRTIKEHMDKEKRLRPQGIKVLSLFFIDEVGRYRSYDDGGNPIKGVYARIFEEEYRRFSVHPDYTTLFQEVDLTHAPDKVHDGYFSIDRKGGWTDTAENNQTNRDNAERAYSLIMRDKERLLSLSTPLKFIFSHSALREGWDNPNVFQICTLRDIQTQRERRQTIGRGLRLCVNQDGLRLHGFELNTLTVIATEPFEQFAENLQKEIEADTGIRFGIVEEHQFAGIPVLGADGAAYPMGLEHSKVIWAHCKAAGYIDDKGKVQDDLKKALKENTLTLPPEYEAQREEITQVLRKLAGKLDIKKSEDGRQIRLKKEVYLSPEFKELWDRIKHKTTYRVRFDNEALVEQCVKLLMQAPEIPKARLEWRKADLAIGKAGVETRERSGSTTVILDETDIDLPDLLTELQDRTQLTRRSLLRIVTASQRLNEFKRNPQAYIELAAEIVNRCKRLAVVDGIKYQRLGDEHYYAQELFEQEELMGYLENMFLDTGKSVHEHVVYQSDTEKAFAQGLERNSAVKVYAKLPGWFKIPTPLDSYNPDWAVLVQTDEGLRLYFVVETKSSLFADDLRAKERAKIQCGAAHFQALQVGESPAKYVLASRIEELMQKCQERSA